MVVLVACEEVCTSLNGKRPHANHLNGGSCHTPAPHDLWEFRTLDHLLAVIW